MKAIRKVLASIRTADNRFNLINNDDKIIVGVSGGKDSMVLFYSLHLYKKFSQSNFEIQPVMLDLGFPGFDPKEITIFCEQLGYNLIVEDAKTVFPILSANKKDGKHLPCSICSRMKKAAINAVANRLGFNKVSFAHHADDAIETLFMNEIYGGRIATFSPKMHLEKSNIDFIRPLILVREDDIRRCANEEKLPIMNKICPADTLTTREDIKNILKNMYEKYPEAKENFLSMLSNYEKLDVFYNETYEKVENSNLSLRPVLNKNDALIMFDIRHKVFVEEQNVSYDEEMDGSDTTTDSFIIYLKKTPIGVIRINQERANEFHISRFAILKEYRNKGYGAKVLNYLERKIVKQVNPVVFTLNAQIQALDFYKKSNYVTIGEQFIEANIPHIKIIKEIKY